MSFDLQAVTRMLHHATDALARLVQRARLTELRAEQPLGDLTWRNAPFTGRTDLTAVSPGHGPVVIDLKRRSANRLRETLRRGSAIQLAAYAFALEASSAYFSITNATLLTTNPEAFGQAYANAGPGDQVTWSRVEATLARTEAVLAQGRVPVTGLASSPEAAATFGVPEGEEDRYLVPAKRQVQEEVCGHCAFAPVCGRQWEELS
jgi:plastocyanin